MTLSLAGRTAKFINNLTVLETASAKELSILSPPYCCHAMLHFMLLTLKCYVIKPKYMI